MKSYILQEMDSKGLRFDAPLIYRIKTLLRATGGESSTVSEMNAYDVYPVLGPGLVQN